MFGRLAFRRFVAALLLIVAALAFARPAFAASDDVQVSWRLLDYLGVDYAGAVKNGAVISASEYARCASSRARFISASRRFLRTRRDQRS